MNPDQDMVYLARFLLTIGAAGYMLPTIVAACRRHPSTLAIGAINLFLGWSMIGYLYAAVLAAAPIQRRPNSQPFTPAAGYRGHARVEPRL